MQEIINISDEPIQTHQLEFTRGLVLMRLEYNAISQAWFMSLNYTDENSVQRRPINGVKLSLSTLHFKHRNWPFDIAINDTTGLGVDPYNLQDLSTGRCEISFITPDEMILLRGVNVE